MNNIYFLENDIKKLKEEKGWKNVLLVCDKIYDNLYIKEYINQLNINVVKFSDFTPNPLYDDVVKGVKILKENNCDSILAIGGGSSIDVAKCIKLFSNMDDEKNYLEQEFKDVSLPLIAIPTTAGTGSEQTKYAVIYYDGKKQSVTHDTIIPDYVFLLPDLIKSLPIYQKKCTMLDALGQAIESYWSVNSTDESKNYSKEAIKLIKDNYKEYLEENTYDSRKNMLIASNLAGRAINVTQTTSAHAMSYKITSLYKVPHGQAVFMTLPYIYEYMLNNLDKTIDSRGKEYLKVTLEEIADLLSCKTTKEAIENLKKLYDSFQFDDIKHTNQELEMLANSVNPIRLKNNPVHLDEGVIKSIYVKSLERGDNNGRK